MSKNNLHWQKCCEIYVFFSLVSGEGNQEIFHKTNSFTPVPREMKCQICNKMFPDRNRGEVPSYKQHYLTVHGDVPPEFKGNKDYILWNKLESI